MSCAGQPILTGTRSLEEPLVERILANFAVFAMKTDEVIIQPRHNCCFCNVLLLGIAAALHKPRNPDENGSTF